ncbi:periplasmic heavy metal sensor [Sphingomonas flavalba]|uniref:periplasmic heavy metal sensor n=1 Tax=Sphingomonas flavalba TaxID=2559804 RepID=UPI0039E1C541
MTKSRIALVAIIAFLAALAGVAAGRIMLPAPQPSETELHALLHRQMDLTADQHARLDRIEQDFAVRRKALERGMRSDNARLAEAIAAEQGYGPRVSAAIDHSHMLMGDLQKVTLEHIFAMRAVLRPDQKARFDRAVTKALTDPKP